MACADKYLYAFEAVLRPVMAEYSSDITRMFGLMPRLNNTKDEVAYISRSEKVKKMLVERHRLAVYRSMCTYKFVEIFPLVREVDKLDKSEYQKVLILMVVMGYSHQDIARVLITDTSTISTLKNECSSTIRHMENRMFELGLAA